MASIPTLKRNPTRTSLGFGLGGLNRAYIGKNVTQIVQRWKKPKPTLMHHVHRLWELKTRDSAERWRNPTAALMHSALKAAVSAVPFAGFVFDSEFLERVVQEAYPDWHARAQEVQWLTASERLDISNRMLSAVKAHVQEAASRSDHPQNLKARLWLKGMQQRQKQLRLQLATNMAAFKTTARKPTAREAMLTNIRHVQRATRMNQQPVMTQVRTISRPALTASHFKKLKELRERKTA